MFTIRLYQTIAAVMLALAFTTMLIGAGVPIWAAIETSGFQNLTGLPLSARDLGAAVGISLAGSLVFLWSARQFAGFAANRRAHR